MVVAGVVLAKRLHNSHLSDRQSYALGCLEVVHVH